jgi:hypothetical protein
VFQVYLNFRSALRPYTNTQRKAKNVAEPGVEPSTCGALGGCSTDWAMEARYRGSLLATSHSRPSRKAKRHQSVEGTFFLFTRQITIRAYLKCGGQHIKRLLFGVPFLRGPRSRHPKCRTGPAPRRVAPPIAVTRVKSLVFAHLILHVIWCTTFYICFTSAG